MLDELIAKLNKQQQQAVMAGDGPVLVLAGPGSGKTRVLTLRVAYLISKVGVRPYHLLAVTFTNKAAREMERRVQELLGEQQARGLTLGTFHAVCSRILRREAEYLPFNANFAIFDTDDQLSLIKQAIAELDLDEKRHRPAAIHAAISNAKNELVGPGDYPANGYREAVIQKVYRRYQELLLANNAVDFDDLLLWTALMLQEQPAVRERYARRFEHVLVDEFQDTNQAQYLLLKYLASFHRNLFVVGDADQSIYRWRGADYRNVRRFEVDYPDRQLILLEQNYRSTQAILDTAMAVIDCNPNRVRKHLFTQLGSGEPVTLHCAYDDRTEAAFVVEIILQQTARRQAQPGDFAVMYRTNAQSRVLEEAFLHAALPYKLVGAQRFYGRREIKDVIAYLRLVHNPQDEVSFSRVINTPARGIGEKTLLALRGQAQKAGRQPAELVMEWAQTPTAAPGDLFTRRALEALLRFGQKLNAWHAAKDEVPPLALMDNILTEIDYHGYVDDGTEEGQDRWDNVMELRRLASEYTEKGLAAFLEQVALVSDQDTLEANANAPTLLTLHAAKGLEFPTVFIVGLSDGILPHARSFDDPEAMEEERRLLYVGITRAKQRLYLVTPQNRSAYGYTEPVEVSRFLEEIPEHLMRLTPQSIPKESPSYQAPFRPERWLGQERKSAAQAGAKTSKPRTPVVRYPPGTRVIHPSWGEGMVLNSQWLDGDEVVDIFFKDVGMKRVAASLARLDAAKPQESE